MRRQFHCCARVGFAIALLAFSHSACWAGSLVNFQFAAGGPVVQAQSGVLIYNSATGAFGSSSDAVAMTADALAPFGGPLAFFSSGTMSISLTVDKSGNLVSGLPGFSLTGSIDLNGDGTDDVSGTLLRGRITSFGTAPAGPATWQYNGTFLIQGGLLTAPVALSGGGTVGPLFTLGSTGGFLGNVEDTISGTLGDFSQDFASDQDKPVAGPLPEPATLVAGLIGGGLMLARSLRRRRRGFQT
jgi:hypothetical protein